MKLTKLIIEYWKYCKTMHAAIAKAYKMIQTGDYTIIGIETEYPNIGQD
jgi:hypothetical protein